MTPAALKQRVLDELGVVAEGAPYPVDDVTKVADKYTGLHAQLMAKGIATWAITEEVPDEASNALVMMLAFASANVFGVPAPRYERLRLLGALDDEQPSLAERQMRKALTPKPVSSTLSSTYY